MLTPPFPFPPIDGHQGLSTILKGGIVYVAMLGLLGPLVRYLCSPSSPEDIPPILNYIGIIPVLLLVLGAMAAHPPRKVRRTGSLPARSPGLISDSTHPTKRSLGVVLGALASLTSFVGAGLILLGGLLDHLGASRAKLLLFGRLCPCYRRISDGCRTSDSRRRDYSCEGIAGVGRGADDPRQPARGVFVRWAL